MTTRLWNSAAAQAQDQLDLDGNAPVKQPHAFLRRDARHTSVEAGRRAVPNSITNRDRVMFVISKPRGATDQEAAVYLGLPENSVRPRRLELLKAGAIVDSGERRKTTSGSQAVVWKRS